MRSKSYKDSKDVESKSGNDNKRRANGGKGKKSKYSSAKLDSRGRDNDPNFYFTSAELAQQAAQLSFQNMLGLGGVDNYKVPSMCRIRLNPCPGVSYFQLGFTGNPGFEENGAPTAVDSTKHGINLMSSKLYTMLSTFTGRTSQYAPQDVAMMILAISSIAELSEHIRRIFGIALTYNPRNRDLPLGLIRTMGIDVVDFLAHIPEYRMKFNVSMTRINQIPLLDNIAYIKKSREIYQRVYMDSMSPMAQLFFYVPYSIWELDETSDPNGTMLRSYGLTSGRGTVLMSALLNRLESMITKLLESTTLNLIYADLLNMANKIQVPTWQFDYLAENYVVMPEYNRNALLQFHHLRAIGAPAIFADSPAVYSKTKRWQWDDTDPTKLTPNMTLTNSNDVVSDPNTNNVVYSPAFFDRSYTKTVVDMETSNPTIEDKIEALRFSTVSSGSKVLSSDFNPTAATTGSHLAILPALPDHYAVEILVVGNVDYTVANLDNRTYFSYTVMKSTQVTNAILADMGKLNHGPLLYLNDYSTYNTVEEVFGDLDFYTMVDYNYLARVNDMMYTGLFDFRV